jgi:phenylacetic acid degradation operon negative regulatory protein
MSTLRLAELRAGVWTRPSNLIRSWPEAISDRVWQFETKAGFDGASPVEVAGSLWPLSTWASRAEALIDALDGSANPAPRFMVAASIVRHFRDDPVLPPALLPRGWPGARLRGAYESYEIELGELMRRERDRQRAGVGGRRSGPAARKGG